MCIRDLASEPPSKQCRTQYSYDVTIRAAIIGKYTYNESASNAVWHFSTLLGHRVHESMARNFQDTYINNGELKTEFFVA